MSGSNSADLTACDMEPIQFLGCVQPHGFLLELSSDWLVKRASANIEAFLGCTAQSALGRPADDVLGRSAVHDIRGQMQATMGDGGVQRVFDLKLVPDAPPFDVSVHRIGDSLIIECEPANPDDAGIAEAVQPLLMQLRGLRPLSRLFAQVARQVRVLTGFDRVMIYRFLPDGSGEVVAETKRSGLVPYKGLRYPATDIPKQARALYERNLIRAIADVDAAISPVLPNLDPAGMPLDLSMSTLRAVSPVHLEYLRNMGVTASMSISVLTGGKLWGLIACHHPTPRRLSLKARTTLEFVSQMFTAILESELREEERTHQTAVRALHSDILSALTGEGATIDDVLPQLRQMQALLAADGLATCIEGRIRLSGSAPDPEQVGALMQFLNRTAASRIYTTHALSAVLPDAAAYAASASGVLAVPVSRKPRDYVLFFRRELVQQVSWAGEPGKTVDANERLSPRKSFDAWRETVRGQSAAWSEAEIHAAETLRVTLLETMLQVTDRAEKQRKQSNDQQDLLIAELNHRVRNILNLIVGLVRQCADGATSTAGLASDISQRVHALARAHDQLTSSGWAARSFSHMIKVEASAYLGSKAERIRMSGEDICIRPDAFATLALVMHELITNAAKYGAFRDSRGFVEIALGRDEAEGLVIEWSEHGGAPVVEPTRRGFGSTIIERAIPHELSGSAETRFEPDGLRARFTVPVRYISAVDQVDEAPVDLAEVATDGADHISGDILLVEDNLLIALETEDALYTIGAEDVHVASTTSAALSHLAAARPHFAVLDYNLGRESSAPVADRLIALGIPFVFATGYGDTAAIDSRFRGRPVLSKPYAARSILNAYNVLQRISPPSAAE